MEFWSSESEYVDTDTTQAIVPRMRAMVQDLGLEHFSFIFLKGQTLSNGVIDTTLRTSYPGEWVDRYTRLEYWNVDPVTELGRGIIRPFFWGQGPFLQDFSKPQRLVFDEAGVFDINYGMTIPVRGTKGELSLFSVVSPKKSHLQEAVRKASARLMSAAFDTHDVALKDLPQEADSAVTLTQREKECLSWTLEGKTAGEIATILGISVSTVNQHASSASHKLGSLNKHHAAVQALRRNLIH